jgi:hypothetical protein
MVQQLDNVRLQHKLMVIGAKPFGHQTRIGQFIEFLLAETDGKGLNARCRHRGHGGHHRTGIDSTAKERPDRDVADHMIADGLIQLGTQLLNRVSF